MASWGLVGDESALFRKSCAPFHPLMSVCHPDLVGICPFRPLLLPSLPTLLTLLGSSLSLLFLSRSLVSFSLVNAINFPPLLTRHAPPQCLAVLGESLGGIACFASPSLSASHRCPSQRQGYVALILILLQTTNDAVKI